MISVTITGTGGNTSTFKWKYNGVNPYCSLAGMERTLKSSEQRLKNVIVKRVL